MDYKSERWKLLRARVLRRDKSLCRECRRYGRTVQANTVHHVWPASGHPEFRWCDWNLISLCASCHNAMHHRDSDALTDLGEYWRRRTIPPPSGGREGSRGDRPMEIFPTAGKTPEGVSAGAPAQDPGADV